MTPRDTDRRLTDPASWPEPDRAWAARLELALARHGLRRSTIRSLLAQTRETVGLIGRPAQGCLGTADDYAAELAREHASDVERVDADLTAPGLRSWVSWVCTGSGLMLAALGGMSLATGAAADSPGLLPLTLTLGVGAALLSGAWTLLQNGRVGSASAAGLAFLPVCGLGGWWTTRAPEQGLVVPPAAVLGVGLALLAVGLLVPATRHDLPGPPEETDEWARRLRGLLVGRHLFTPGEARAAAADVVDHLDGERAADQFGHPERYAQLLAQDSDRAAARRRRLHAAMWAAWGVVIGVVILRTVLAGGLDLPGVLLVGALALVLGYAAWRVVLAGRDPGAPAR